MTGFKPEGGENPDNEENNKKEHKLNPQQRMATFFEYMRQEEMLQDAIDRIEAEDREDSSVNALAALKTELNRIILERKNLPEKEQ